MATSARVGFGDYAPDLPSLLNPGLTVARNTVPIAGGYSGHRAKANLSAFSALASRPRGAIAGVDRDGNPYNFAGTQTALYALTNATHDVTRSSGAYNCRSFWEFVVFDRYVIAVNLNDDAQYYDLNNPPGTVASPGSGSNFVQLGNPTVASPTVAPRAAHAGVIGGFVMLGNTFDAVNGPGPDAVHWSGLNDPFNWPAIGSEQAVAVQSGRQRLQGDGGQVQRVVQGAEVGAIFQERAVWRADFRGGDVIFEFNRVEPLRGLLVPQIAIPFGRQVFYLAEDGFYLFDYTQSQSIGREIIDRTFLADVDLEHADRISAAADPNEQRVWILYPGAGNSGGTPNKYLCYDWGLNRWAHGDEASEWLAQVAQAGRSLDAAATTEDPDDLVFDDSFDDRIAPVGALELGAYDTTFRLSDFSGAGLEAVLETGRREFSPGRRSMATRVRVLVDAVAPTVQVASFGRARESLERWTKPARITDSGEANVRSDGRYHKIRVTMPTGFEDALAMDVDFRPSGRR